MDKKKSILNVSVSVGFKIITMIMSIIVKRMLIQYCGNEVNGLNALYLSIIGFLGVAELGIGSAIIFCMYRPVVEGDIKKVSSLYFFFKKAYLLIGGFIFLCGLALAPFVHLLARDYAGLNVDFASTFILMLVSVVVSYMFGADTALINAYKNNYITTTISSTGILLQHVLQIAVLMATRSFVGYLICRIVAVVAQWIISHWVAKRKYKTILKGRYPIQKDTKEELVKHIKALFLHTLGAMLVFSVDNIVISAFVGVLALGEYSNYSVIEGSMTGIIVLVFSSLSSVLGHVYASERKEVVRNYCDLFHMVNFAVGIVFYLGYYAIADSLIAILFAESLVVNKSIPMVIATNGFIQYMRQNALTFRNAAGLYYYDRWKPLVEGITNLVLSVVGVKLIGVAGVILATVVTNLIICHVVEPYILYKYAFGVSPREYCMRNYMMIAVFGVALLLLDKCMQTMDNQWAELLVNGFLSVGISLLGCAVIFWINRKKCIQAIVCIGGT